MPRSPLAIFVFALTPALGGPVLFQAQPSVAVELDGSAGLASLAGKPVAQMAMAEPPAGGPTANAPKSIVTIESRGQSESRGQAGQAQGSRSKSASLTGPGSADDALGVLQEGNARWVADKCQNPNDEVSRRAQLAAEGQKPIATIITCADSRLPVERIFDRGVGELFVIRVAGNVAGDSETGTIEYGVEHLHTPLVVVMGHTKCGAVAAATGKELPHGKLGTLVSRITPAVERARKGMPGVDEAQLAAAAVRENVWQTIYDLMKNSPDIRTAAKNGEIQVVGAVCDIATGRVDWIGEHPWQTEILAALDRPATPTQAKAGGEDH